MSHTDGSPGGGAVDHDPGASRSYSGNPRDTDQDRDPSDRNRYRRRSPGRMQLPAEFADFKLADGRTLRDVMGDRFFGAGVGAGGGKWMSKGVRERLLEGGWPNLSARAGARRAERKARAEAWRAERQARIEKWRAIKPGGGFFPGGGL